MFENFKNLTFLCIKNSMRRKIFQLILLRNTLYVLQQSSMFSNDSPTHIPSNPNDQYPPQRKHE
jgi:hypothetical protein